MHNLLILRVYSRVSRNRRIIIVEFDSYRSLCFGLPPTVDQDYSEGDNSDGFPLVSSGKFVYSSVIRVHVASSLIHLAICLVNYLYIIKVPQISLFLDIACT